MKNSKNQQEEFIKILEGLEKKFDDCGQPNTSGIIAGIKKIYLKVIGGNKDE